MASAIIASKKGSEPEKRADEISAELMKHTESLMQGIATKDATAAAHSLNAILSLKNQGK